jgi:hypothetical protein
MPYIEPTNMLCSACNRSESPLTRGQRPSNHRGCFLPHGHHSICHVCSSSRRVVCQVAADTATSRIGNAETGQACVSACLRRKNIHIRAANARCIGRIIEDGNKTRGTIGCPQSSVYFRSRDRFPFSTPVELAQGTSRARAIPRSIVCFCYSRMQTSGSWSKVCTEPRR